jgi:hypothetical protein
MEVGCKAPRGLGDPPDGSHLFLPDQRTTSLPAARDLAISTRQ